jgi:hypothetical protein
VSVHRPTLLCQFVGVALHFFAQLTQEIDQVRKAAEHEDADGDGRPESDCRRDGEQGIHPYDDATAGGTAETVGVVVAVFTTVGTGATVVLFVAETVAPVVTPLCAI